MIQHSIPQQEKSLEYESLNLWHKEETGEHQSRLRKEMAELDTELGKLKERTGQLQHDNLTKDTLTQQLRYALHSSF